MSKRTVAVVDYGMGNLRSVAQAVAHVAREEATAGDEIDVVVTADPDVVVAAERVVLPGQGAMPDCMRELRESGLQAAVLEAAASKPLARRLHRHADAARPQRGRRAAGGTPGSA